MPTYLGAYASCRSPRGAFAQKKYNLAFIHMGEMLEDSVLNMNNISKDSQ